MTPREQGRTLMVLTMALAFALTIVPLPDALELMRPHWVALFLLYWNLEGGRLRTLGQAFVLGLLLDVLTGTLLGQHALGLVILVYLLERFRARIRFFPPWQQAVAILALLVNESVIQAWVIGLAGYPWPPWQWWLSPLVAVLIWPWLFLALDALRRRERLHRS